MPRELFSSVHAYGSKLLNRYLLLVFARLRASKNQQRREDKYR